MFLIKYIDNKSKGLLPKVMVNKLNKKFIKEEIKNTQELLSNINSHSLDYHQRVAVITDECSNLVLAGAGSGKSLTIIGKIRYLVEVKGINPNEILCITFTREAAQSLENKINNNYNYNINVYTFHKLALNILSKENYIISNPNTLQFIVDEYFYMIQYNRYMVNKVKKTLLINSSYRSILKSKELISLKKTIITFIHLFKTNNYKITDFIKFKGNKDLLRIIIDIYLLYEEELKSKNEIDFNDMIIKAIDYLDTSDDVCDYKYIIVDEYQDTSYIRYLLIKKIKDKTGAKIMCVGDDYQSIYRFTGCNLNMFLNFKKYFGYTKILTIQNTYRNSQELINVAGRFIMKNKQQLYKKLRSSKSIKKPIKIMYGDNLSKLLDLVLSHHQNVIVLGRNNFDIDKYFKVENDYFEYNDKKIKYLTVHRSKGLEEESIILINLKDDILGFPNKKVNDSILKNVLDNRKVYPFDEERRLFYVALTRTKSDIYLLVPKKNKSIFINELIDNYSKYIEFV